MFHASFNTQRKDVSYTLVITFPDGSVHSFPVGEAAITVGRSPSTAIRVSEEGVSRQHCVISPTSGRLIVLDQGSTNGTYVNGALVQQARLNDGDVIQVGTARIRVKTQSETNEDTTDVRPSQPPFLPFEEDVQTQTYEFGGATYLLQRLAESLASSDGAASAAELVLGCVMEVFPVDHAYILTFGNQKIGETVEVLESKSRSSETDTTGEIELDLPQKIMDCLLSDPNLTNAEDATSAVRSAISENYSGPLICAPLRQGSETFGALYADALTMPEWAQSREMLRFLSAVGALAALSIGRARLQTNLGMEQRVSQQATDHPGPSDRSSSRERRSSHPYIRSKPYRHESIRTVNRVQATALKYLLEDVSGLAQNMNDKLGAVGKRLGDASEEMIALVEAMTTCRKLVASVENVALASSLRAGMQKLSSKPTEINELVGIVIKRNRSKASKKKVTLERGSIEGTVSAVLDESLTIRILDLLVKHSLQHAGRMGKIVFSARKTSASAEIIIADTGQSVPEEARESFFSGLPSDYSRKGRRGGNDMLLCSLAASEQGGSIRVEGTSGNHRIVLSLPLE